MKTEKQISGELDTLGFVWVENKCFCCDGYFMVPSGLPTVGDYCLCRECRLADDPWQWLAEYDVSNRIAMRADIQERIEGLTAKIPAGTVCTDDNHCGGHLTEQEEAELNELFRLQATMNEQGEK